MKLKPLHDNVIVKPSSIEDMTKSGIVLPETANNERPERGEVVAVGPGKILEMENKIHWKCKIGDKVVFKNILPMKLK